MDIAFSTIELKDDTIIVVLGASGDLAKKKTVRAPPSWIPMTPTNNLAVPRTIRSRMCATYELSQLQSTDHVLQFRNKFLPKDIQIVGYARTKMDHDEYLKRVRSYIKVPTKEIEEQLDQFCNMCTYVSGQYDQDDSFINLNKHLEKIEQGRQGKEQNRVFYMALPPSVFITVSEQLKRNCYPKSGLARIIVSRYSDSHGCLC